VSGTQRQGLVTASSRAAQDRRLLVKMVKANGLVSKDFGTGWSLHYETVFSWLSPVIAVTEFRLLLSLAGLPLVEGTSEYVPYFSYVQNSSNVNSKLQC